ncbi:hypothetical protein [Nonomuraea basaltis]|uniref:hypothetical protein n=1 Tax=Nonomuraea basaltis TaxID=2495887 RepID=UPI00148716DF|nr:hypothetical protein [Nonomuraea basaltis]
MSDTHAVCIRRRATMPAVGMPQGVHAVHAQGEDDEQEAARDPQREASPHDSHRASLLIGMSRGPSVY